MAIPQPEAEASSDTSSDEEDVADSRHSDTGLVDRMIQEARINGDIQEEISFEIPFSLQIDALEHNAPGRTHSLEVNTVSCKEGSSCQPKGHVLRAWYGTADEPWSVETGKNVTRKVCALLSTSSTVHASNETFGDPAPYTWQKKVLLIEVQDMEGSQSSSSLAPRAEPLCVDAVTLQHLSSPREMARPMVSSPVQPVAPHDDPLSACSLDSPEPESQSPVGPVQPRRSTRGGKPKTERHGVRRGLRRLKKGVVALEAVCQGLEEASAECQGLNSELVHDTLIAEHQRMMEELRRLSEEEPVSVSRGEAGEEGVEALRRYVSSLIGEKQMPGHETPPCFNPPPLLMPALTLLEPQAATQCAMPAIPMPARPMTQLHSSLAAMTAIPMTQQASPRQTTNQQAPSWQRWIRDPAVDMALMSPPVLQMPSQAFSPRQGPQPTAAPPMRFQLSPLGRCDTAGTAHSDRGLRWAHANVAGTAHGTAMYNNVHAMNFPQRFLGRSEYEPARVL